VEWSELPCKTQTFKTIAEKYLYNFISTILLTDENIFTLITPKTQCRPTHLLQTNKKKDVTTKRDQRSEVTDGISRRVNSCPLNTSLILVDHGVKVTEGCYRNVMLL